LITADLEAIQDSDSETRLWIIYPQLNIGHYRFLLGRAGAYRKYKVALQRAVEVCRTNASFVTIPPEEYEEFWRAYVDDLTPDPGRENHVGRLTSEAKWFITQVTHHEGRHIPVPLTSLPPQAIVIGKVSYQIATYGIPAPQGSRYHKPPQNRFPAHIVAYRRTDETLASCIVEDTRRLLSTFQGGDPTLRESA
jgi:hypothetical protein